MFCWNFRSNSSYNEKCEPCSKVQHQMHQAPQMPVPVTGQQQQQRFRSDGSGDLMFNPFQQTTTKPIFDPNSYDRKIESVR